MDAVLLCEHPAMPPAASPPDAVAEANHRIANSLTLLGGMVRMQVMAVKKNPTPFTNAEVRVLLDGVSCRINTISQLHRLLSRVPYDEATSLMAHLRDVTTALVAALSSPEQAVTVTHGASDCLIAARQMQPIVLILCEIFINALKYAHPAGVPLRMTVDCTPTVDGGLVIGIGDDGVGLPEGFDPHAGDGFGFRVMRGLAAEIGATLDIESTGLGLLLRLSLPAGTVAGGRVS